jgi:hypothetical protein
MVVGAVRQGRLAAPGGAHLAKGVFWRLRASVRHQSAISAGEQIVQQRKAIHLGGSRSGDRMKGLLVLQTVLALPETALCCILVTLISGVALAQTPGTVDPSPAPAEPSTKEDMLPPGACMPIGVTVSGEIVFPFQCKDFIERQKAADQKPAAAEEKPAAARERPADAQEKPTAPEEKAATKLPAIEESNNGKPAAEPTETGAIPKHGKYKQRARSVTASGCTRFRTYDRESGTYRGYDGLRHSCP